MTKELRAEWVAALRSGEYKQGTGILRNENDEFCCLGVLWDLHLRKEDKEWDRQEDGAFCIRPGKGGSVIGFIPLQNLESFGLSDYVAARLARKNDVDLDTFAEIADYIENLDDDELAYYSGPDPINPPGDDSEQSGTE